MPDESLPKQPPRMEAEELLPPEVTALQAEAEGALAEMESALAEMEASPVADKATIAEMKTTVGSGAIFFLASDAAFASFITILTPGDGNSRLRSR